MLKHPYLLPTCLLLVACSDDPIEEVGIETSAASALSGGNSLAVGESFSCAIRPGGKVRCWGDGWGGQLGLGSTARHGDFPGTMGSNLPNVDLGSGVVAKAIVAGRHHACVLATTGGVKCWGTSSLSEAVGAKPGDMGNALPYVPLGPGRSAKVLASGPNATATCAILDDDSVKCWGANVSGVLGQGNSAIVDYLGEAGIRKLRPVDLGAKAIAIDVGDAFACAVLRNGDVKCWGDTRLGKGTSPLGIRNFGSNIAIGDEPGEMGPSLRAVELGSDFVAIDVTAGAKFACALAADGRVKCWGEGFPIFNHIPNDAPIAVQLNAPPTAKMDAGVLNLALMDRQGSLRVLGDNRSGQLGLGSKLGLIAVLGPGYPTTDDGSGSILGVATGKFHACAAISDGSVRCWGQGMYGALGTESIQSIGDSPGEMGSALKAVVF
jgi:uncharacterized RmlC-like cupin family protein